MSIDVRHVSKTFGIFAALRDVSISVPTGMLVALLGPSGSGKTTLLRIIAGLEAPDPPTGAPVLFFGRDVACRPARHRNVGFVFQHYALFRHMTAAENIAFGLRVRPRRVRLSDREIRERVMSLARLIQIDGLEHRYPHELSGGQRQRVALARALAIQPRILLLDEPFGALDARVRHELRCWLRRLHDEIRVTTVLVTHDQEEAMEVADRVVVMNQGRVEQEGAPEQVFHDPASEFVMRFLGRVNLFRGRMEQGRAVFGPISLARPDCAADEGREARCFVRPYDLYIRDSPGGPGTITARVARVRSAGPAVRVDLVSDSGQSLLAEMPHERFRELKITAGSLVFVGLREARVFT